MRSVDVYLDQVDCFASRARLMLTLPVSRITEEAGPYEERTILFANEAIRIAAESGCTAGEIFAAIQLGAPDLPSI